MTQLCFIVNNKDAFNAHSHLKTYLPNAHVEFHESLPSNSESFDLVVLWNYQKIVPGVEGKTNIILFHGSDLPEGKGWAPIYYTLANGLSHYTLTGIRAAPKVDSGEVLVKARFKIKENYTAEALRAWDDEISIRLVKEILERFKGKKIKGRSQVEKGSTYARRRPEDNEVDPNAPLSTLMPHLRACEPLHPAFIKYNGTKYILSVSPETPPTFPEDLEIEFF